MRGRAQIPACPVRAVRVPVPFVSLIPPTPQARFAGIIDLLCRGVAARIAGGRLAGPLIILICSRLRRMGIRFGRLAARVEAGRPSRARRRPAAPRPPRARAPRKPRLPQGFAWVIRLVPYTAAGSASQLQHLLAEPDMAALIAAAPSVGRLLRPLCRMLGVRPPPALRLPPPAGPMVAPRRAATRRPPRSAAVPTSSPRPRRPAPSPVPPPRACGPPVDAV